MATTKKKKPVRKEVVDSATIDRAVLARALNTAGKAVNSNSTLPLLTNMLFECSNGESSVAATDLEIGVRCRFNAVGIPFRTCVPAKTFQSFIDALNVDSIEMRMDDADQSVSVMAERNTSTIKCISAEEFPDIPSVEEPQVIIPVIQFKHMVNRVAFAVSNDDNRGVLVGVLLMVEGEDDDKKFLMFAADGNRASYEETTQTIFQGEHNFKAIIKGTTLETIARMLPDDGMLEIEARGPKLLFHCEDIDVISQVLGGDFPDHHLIAESVKKRDTTIKLQTLELLRACKQLKIFAKETGATVLDIQDMFVQYSTMRHEQGDSAITMFAEKEGDDIAVGLNAFLLHELLEVVKTPRVVISLAGNKKPMLFRMEGVEEFFHIIMPVFIQ